MAEKSDPIILCALTLEARAIERSLGWWKFDVRVIGMRGKRVPKIENGSVVIVAGLGGGLDPSLGVGDVVLDCNQAPGLESRGLVNAAFSWRAGRIHTSANAVCTVAEKSTLFAETGALAVDMEQSRVREESGADVQIIGLRAISDSAHIAIDPVVLTFMNDAGRIKPMTLFSTLLRRPGLIPHLRELNSNSRLALRQLGFAIAALVEKLSEHP